MTAHAANSPSQKPPSLVKQEDTRASEDHFDSAVDARQRSMPFLVPLLYGRQRAVFPVL